MASPTNAQSSFEEQLKELETVVERLERGDLTLEENVSLFERGVHLSNACKKQLDQAESRVQVLLEPESDSPVRVENLVIEVDDEELMEEVRQVRAATSPAETLLVVDAMTGQDAVNTARAFNEAVGVTGIVMTRMDGDARGGAALSMRAIPGAPIKLVGMGEKIDDLEEFHPERVAGRILGMGDVVGLVEKAAEVIDQEEAEKLARKMAKGRFDLEDYAKQLKQINKMGSLSSILGMLPGAGKIQAQLEAAGQGDLDKKLLNRQAAIIGSMTVKERRAPDIIKASRKKRIAAGSGTSVQEVNKLLKQFEDMSAMMKRMNKLGQKGLARHGLAALLPGNRRPF